MEKTFCFTVDDNIRFLKELALSPKPSLFDHPYPAMYRELHKHFGVKVQLNLFYEMPGFDLSRFPDRYREEFAANAHWLKLSFHSQLENVKPYEFSGYAEVRSHCEAVHREILRFAGPDSLGKTTTVHYCRTTPEGLRAMKDCGMAGLLGLFGTDEEPRISYSAPEELGAQIRHGAVIPFDGVALGSIDMVINNVALEDIIPGLSVLLPRDQLRVMIHEQYFYPDYDRYQPEFAQKLATCFAWLGQQGYQSRFFEEMIG